MLFKVQYQGKKKYVKLNGASYPAFLREAKEKFSIPPETNMYVLDDSGTEVDEEVFSDILEEKADILWTIVNVLSVSDSPIQSSCTDTLSLSSPSSDSDTSLMSPKRQRIDDAFVMSPKSLHTDDSSSQAKELIKRILEQKPGGEKILANYAMTGEMKDRARRDLVGIVVAEMFEKYGRAPPMDKRAQYALGIVTLFPSLKDPYSKKGYEHFFDIDSNEGYIAWKIKNTQRELSNGGTSGGRRRSSRTIGSSGPNLEREVTKVQQLEGDQCREAISLLKHSTDNEQIFMKMRETFQHRQKLIHDPEQCSTVLTVFPRFLDTKGLVTQDFDLLFGAETSSKLLEKWDFLKAKVIEQAKNISKTPLLDHLIQSAEENTDEDDEVPGWDSDMASLLLLVYLLPPPPSGKKGAVKISTREAVDHVVKFHKSCRSLQEHSGPNQRRQPYILAVGTTRKHIHEFYIALDGDLLPCKALPRSDGHSVKMEDWTSMTSVASMRPFPPGINGAEKTNNESDLKYPQQSSSCLPGYVSACAYSPPNQYGMYGGPAANYMSTGHPWQPQPSLSSSLTQSQAHLSPAAPPEAADLHTATSFKLPQRDEDRKPQSPLYKDHHAAHRLSSGS